MSHSDITKSLYEAFSDHQRPEHFTDYTHCYECAVHDETMRSVDLDTLDSWNLGSVGWTPLHFLTEEGFAYYMPRLMELVITGAKNHLGEPFIIDMLFHLAPDPDYDRFTNYNAGQCKAILEALYYCKVEYCDILQEYLHTEDIEQAIAYWSARVT